MRKASVQTDESQPQFKPLGFSEASDAPLRYGADLRDSTSRKRNAT